MQILKKLAALSALLYSVIALAAWAGQRHLIYAPDPTRVEPATVGLAGIEERWLDVEPGVRVLAWYGRAKPSQPTLLYFHGNGGSLSLRSERIKRFMAQGWGIYMMSYRGYSGSGGVPSEADNVADARRAHADLLRSGVAARDVILYGESLGTGVATQIAVGREAKGLILDAPYTSLVDIGKSRYPFLPVDLLLAHRYETVRIVPQVRLPLLVIHGELDHIVPVEMGRRVFAAAVAAPEPKRLAILPGAGHGNHMRFGSFEAIVAFVAELRRR